MAVHTAISEVEAATILAAHGLGELEAIEGIVGGSVNSNFALDAGGAGGAGARRVFLRVYEEQDRAGAEHETAMLERLASAGVPTPAPLRRVDGPHVSTIRGKPAALFPWRVGTMRCQAGVTAADALRVGEALARVHVAGAREEAYPGRFGFRDLQGRLDRIEADGGPQLTPLVPSLRATLDRTHAAREAGPRLPGGLIHGDLFRDQVLWAADGDIAALLDFESACDGTFAYDLMVTVLAWCVGDDLDFTLARAMREGYERVRVLSDDERRALVAEGSFAALRFAITRITDFSMRAVSASGTVGPVARDWRRFLKRYETLQSLGVGGVRDALGA